VRSNLLLGLAALVAACGFESPHPMTPDGPPADTPPGAGEVRFVSMSAGADLLRPGRHAIEVTAVLHNGLAVELTDLRAELTFRDAAGDRAADFRWRDADARDGVLEPQPSQLPPGEEAVFRFRVDIVAHAGGPGPVVVGGRATFLAGGRARAATALDPPLILPFEELAPPIVVTVAGDEDNNDARISLREAVKAANARPGLDRITFDPAVFPPGGWTSALLRNNLGALPPIDGDLIIDGTGAGFELAVSSSWAGSRRYGLRLAGGTLVVHGIAFRDLGHGYPAEDLGPGNCGSGAQHDGGAIRVDGGTLILYGNRFTDEGVGERNCRAASVRLHGGEGHRILNNTWTAPVMDALYIAAATREVSGNVINAGGAPGKTDDCITIDSQGGADLWIIGNVCADQELTAITAGGSDPGKLYIVHNTFVRNRGPAAVHRAGTQRRVELRGNAYQGNPQAAISADGDGINLQISHEAEVGSARFCAACGAAVIQTSTISSGVDLGLLVPAGSTPADLTPRAASPLVDSGLDLVDRNGSVPRRFNGAGPERGAVELP
jgi:hypothetical protein